MVVDRRYVVHGEPDVLAPLRASTHTGARSREPPAGVSRLHATVASLLLSAATATFARHGHHRLVGAVPRLPGIPRRGRLLLAELRAIRLFGAHFRQGAPLRPRCGGVELPRTPARTHGWKSGAMSMPNPNCQGRR